MADEANATRQQQIRYSDPLPDLALLVPNKGSMARDMLANERNFLTFFRLSGSMVVLGFTVLLKFRLPNVDDHGDVVPGNDDDEWSSDTLRRSIGFVFIALGFCLFIVGISRYFRTQVLLTKQVNFIQAGWGSFIIIGFIFVFVCTVMIIASINSNLFKTHT
ncbi:hypothetical protein VTP01DRAFT_8012 [Rhizomucor pusillus]|uniref:uncharacterized protein n=1 Tax=Rhizomucor pusillus TaxID=4840 RepID=UPI003744379D